MSAQRQEADTCQLISRGFELKGTRLRAPDVIVFQGSEPEKFAQKCFDMFNLSQQLTVAQQHVFLLM